MQTRPGKRCPCSWKRRQLGATRAVILRVGWVGGSSIILWAIADVVVELGGRRRLGGAGVGERRNSRWVLRQDLTRSDTVPSRRSQVPPRGNEHRRRTAAGRRTTRQIKPRPHARR